MSSLQRGLSGPLAQSSVCPPPYNFSHYFVIFRIFIAIFLLNLVLPISFFFCMFVECKWHSCLFCSQLGVQCQTHIGIFFEWIDAHTRTQFWLKMPQILNSCSKFQLNLNHRKFGYTFQFCFFFLFQSSLINSDIIFVKLHAPWEVLGRYAEQMNVRMPFR